jgi:hypothetical protein
MPGGQASHKSTSIKPNINANGLIDDAADLNFDPESVLPEGPDALRAAEAPENSAATQRPEDKKEQE